MQLDAEIWLPADIDRVFSFFSDAMNLEAITPPWLRFRVMTPAPIHMQPGTRLRYRLRLHGIPVGWQSEITEWEPPHRFVDEQRREPYTYWKHTHTFETTRGGTMMRDHVDYGVPFAFVSRWLVMRDLRTVFDYRREAMLKLFPARAWQGSADMD